MAFLGDNTFLVNMQTIIEFNPLRRELIFVNFVTINECGLLSGQYILLYIFTPTTWYGQDVARVNFSAE